MHVPLDIQNEIYKCVNYLSRDKFRLLDKYWNRRHKQFIRSITLIQQSYRKYRIPDSYLYGNVQPRYSINHQNEVTIISIY